MMSWLVLLFLWALQGGIGCAICQMKNRSGVEGFLLGALLGPIGLIIVLCLPKQSPDDGGRRHWTDEVPSTPPPGWRP
jgi:hypothetical protein